MRYTHRRERKKKTKQIKRKDQDNGSLIRDYVIVKSLISS